VNVLHHLPSRDHQHRAFGEIARVLKPGGLFLLHEINVTNPLFRFYMGYVFPLIRQIDEGTERWIDPEAPPTSAGLRRIGVQYFTFVPDFLPQRLLRSALPLEARLERSALARYSAHYMLTFERSDEPVR
jgi:SAM-dependent methyltransferase